MDWFTVHGSLRDHPKWATLSAEGRGAWITLMLIGHGQPRDKRWKLGKPDHVRRLLRREGFASPLDLEVLAELVAATLVDIDEADGTVSLHDASEHQAKHRNAERQQRFRERNAHVTGGNGEADEEPQFEHDVTPRNGEVTPSNETDRQDRQERQTDRRVVPLHRRSTNLAVAVKQITGQDPTDEQAQWIEDLCGSYGREHVSRALWEVKGARTVKHLLSRVSHHFRDGDPLNEQEATS